MASPICGENCTNAAKGTGYFFASAGSALA